jgi:hypothetical protein
MTAYTRAELIVVVDIDGKSRVTACALGITADTVLDLCRDLVAAGHGPDLPLVAYWGDVPALLVRSIGEGATLYVDEVDRKGFNGTPTLSVRRGAKPWKNSDLVSQVQIGGPDSFWRNLQSKNADFAGVKFQNSGSESGIWDSVDRDNRGISGPADVVASELGTTLRDRGTAPLLQDDESGLWRLRYPDGTLGGLAGRAWALDTARREGLIDRTGEHVEADDGTKWRRKVSADGVLTHVTRLQRAKRVQVDWNQCLGCGGRMKYRPGSGRFCGTQCRESFDKGLDFTAQAENEQIAA